MRLAPSTDADVYVAPPILLPPCLFPQRRTPFVVRPLASGDAQPGPPSTSQPSSTVGSTGKTSGNKPLMRLPAPWQGRMAWGGGLGAGAFFGGHGAAKAQRVFTTATTGPNSKPAAKSEEGQKTVLIMYSNTGGGHRASAEALKQAFEEKHGSKYKIHIVDMWQDHTPAPFNQMPNTYSFMVKHSFLWQTAYNVTNPRWFHIPYLNTVGMFIAGGIDKAYEQYNPDLVVSVHPLMQHVPVKVLRQRIQRGASAPTNFATVVTDFTTCHNTWFCRGVSRCFVPTDYCRYLARDNGLEEGQIIMHGLPIRPVFSKKLPAQSALRAKFGMRKNTPAVLLVGGGEGMGKLEETVDQLEAQLGASCQVVVICGRNQALLERLRAKARSYPSGMSVLPLGFVDNIHEWMAASDVIITKAGPGTIAEALISGLPILLNGNVPCQEEGNIPYVIDNEVGTFETRPSKIAEIVSEWFGPLKAELTHMKHRAKELGRPEAVYKIVQDLVKLAETPCMTFGPASVLANGGKGQLRLA